MSMLKCLNDGNTRKWRDATSDRTGTTATCGVCGQAVSDPEVKSQIPIRIAITDSTTFGDGLAETNTF
jgi:hypothetical protein